tara:strand:+ start:477 stop:779 length:303 start_codon:yes stop_codon:yes gene_type:complete
MKTATFTESVTIERSVLEWLTREALEMRQDGLDIAHECDRIAALNVHKAIEVLGNSDQLQAEFNLAREQMWAEHREHMARREAEQEAAVKAAAKAAKAAK